MNVVILVNAKTKKIYLKNISWSQMFQNCIFRQEIAKKLSADDGSAASF